MDDPVDDCMDKQILRCAFVEGCYVMEHGLHGAHPTRAKVTLVCEQLTVIIVLLLADEEQGEPDCINPNGLEVM